MKQKFFGYDFSKETEYTAIIFTCVIFIFWVDYSKTILNLNVVDILLTKITVSLFCILILLQANSIGLAILQNDYIKYCRKIISIAITCCSIGFIFNFPLLYKNLKYAERQVDKTIIKEGSFEYQKGRTFTQFIEFEFKGKHQSISISKQTVNKLEEFQKYNIPICVVVKYRNGLNSTFILQGLEVISCN